MMRIDGDVVMLLAMDVLVVKLFLFVCFLTWISVLIPGFSISDLIPGFEVISVLIPGFSVSVLIPGFRMVMLDVDVLVSAGFLNDGRDSVHVRHVGAWVQGGNQSPCPMVCPGA